MEITDIEAISAFLRIHEVRSNFIKLFDEYITKIIKSLNPKEQRLFESKSGLLMLNVLLELGFGKHIKVRYDQLFELIERKQLSEEETLPFEQLFDYEIHVLAHVLVTTRLAYDEHSFEIFLSELRGNTGEEILKLLELVIKIYQNERGIIDQSGYNKIREQHAQYFI